MARISVSVRVIHDASHHHLFHPLLSSLLSLCSLLSALCSTHLVDDILLAGQELLYEGAVIDQPKAVALACVCEQGTE